MLAPSRSKFFSSVLASVMQARGVNQVQLSKRSDIAVSRVNNCLQGKYPTVKPAHLQAITAAYSPPKLTRAAWAIECGRR